MAVGRTDIFVLLLLSASFETMVKLERRKKKKEKKKKEKKKKKKKRKKKKKQAVVEVLYVGLEI